MVDEELASIPLDSNDFERITLMDLPQIAAYGRYELLGRIAFGGMAEIFLARETDANRMMVVKRVLPHVAEDPTFVEMFRDEARLAMQLNHPNICHVYSFGEVGDTYYLAMEWVNGKPLSKIIRKAREQGGLPIPVAMKIVSQVAEALDYAHRASDASGEPLGIVHRDVSPQNIMVSFDGVVKLLDFGIAKATSHSTQTEAGIIKGKFAYMSPQQCVGEVIDGRADIFALGICLYEAIAGKNPFKRKTEFETMTRIVGEPAPPLLERREDCPTRVGEIVETALKKQPELRYQTAGDMQLEIEETLAQMGAVVNAGRLGDYLKRLFPEDYRDGPALDTRIDQLPSNLPGSQDSGREVERTRKPAPGSTELDAQVYPMQPTPASKKKGGGGFAIAAGAIMALLLLGGLVVAAGVVGWSYLRAEPPEPVALNEPPAVQPAPRPEATPPPTADEPAVPTTGSVFLESDPPGAAVTFDGREVGETPVEIGMVADGPHDVTMTLEGHEDFEDRIIVVAGRRATLTGDLQRVRRAGRGRGRRAPAGPPGRLSLNTRPWSKVYVGNRLLGTTPIGNVEVPSGPVRLRLVDRDGQEHTRTVSVPPGEQVNHSFDLRE